MNFLCKLEEVLVGVVFDVVVVELAGVHVYIQHSNDDVSLA